MNQSDIMLELVRMGARRGVLFTKFNTFNPEEAEDLQINICNQGYLVTKDKISIDYDITDKELAYYLGMLYKKGDKFYDYLQDRVSCNISTLDGIHLHAELHLTAYVSKKELTLHTIAMTNKFNITLRAKNIVCKYKIEKDRGILNRYNSLVIGDKVAFLKDYANYYNDLWNHTDDIEKDPIYQSLINMNFIDLEHFYRNKLLDPVVL